MNYNSFFCVWRCQETLSCFYWYAYLYTYILWFHFTEISHILLGMHGSCKICWSAAPNAPESYQPIYFPCWAMSRNVIRCSWKTNGCGPFWCHLAKLFPNIGIPYVSWRARGIFLGVPACIPRVPSASSCFGYPRLFPDASGCFRFFPDHW